MTIDAEVFWARLTAAEIQARATPETVVLIPVASIEQHGPHLAVGVDTLLATAVAERTARRMLAAGQPALVTPTIWSGLAEHHMAFGGTMTLDLATFSALVGGIARSVARHGFRRIALVNGHGGNTEAVASAAIELTRSLGVPVVGLTYWLANADTFGPILESQPNVMHACEAETSMMMAVAPDCVRTDRIQAAVPKRFAPPAPPGFKRSRPFAEMTDTGVIGDPRSASAEKGERLLEAAAKRLSEEFARPELWS
ncbi:creatininase family protein [Falsiroseomonas tokyonensis]|uniref:Creatininase family protein n=1 Tax=Falsiroseomonas tokyonensis TaxID=430521 RepID=A0ABV7BUC4_9PROT|nr:creatininase family protein [Falsiroseomonas tokyonensis]MBU8539203.1 creatininase family protein [Falsiroseomonas tokyonensis]